MIDLIEYWNKNDVGEKLPDNEYDNYFFEYFPKYIMAGKVF